MANQTIIHLSDLHVGCTKNESPLTSLLFQKIGQSHPGVPVLITGDLADSATKGQFIKTRQLLDTLALTNPILAVPGNHDYAWLGNILRNDGWKNWVRYLGSPLGWKKDIGPWMEKDHEPEGIDGLGIWRDGLCVYFGIDSGDPDDKVVAARGYISDKLANALKEYLVKNADKTRIVLLHHHPFLHDNMFGFFTELKGAEKLLSVLKGNCELLLFGHDHHYGIWWNKNEIPLIVASHKSTDCLDGGDCLMITIIDIENPGTKNVLFHHRTEIIQK
jgi:3',5'-cyclic AMP phosphodiesterase CpdA